MYSAREHLCLAQLLKMHFGGARRVRLNAITRGEALAKIRMVKCGRERHGCEQSFCARIPGELQIQFRRHLEGDRTVSYQ